MPELPEVEIIVRDLKNKVRKRTFIDVWTDFPKMIKKPDSFSKFKKEIIGKKIEKVWRKGKNILFNLSGDYCLLIHQKLTGHLLLGKWKYEKGKWNPLIKGPLSNDPMNRFLHLILFLDNKEQLALSDLRKFAKVKLQKCKELMTSDDIKSLGTDPLEKNLTFGIFKKIIYSRKKKIKQILMDQTLISGIGNIYSDEILFEAKINPLRYSNDLSENEVKRIYEAMHKILRKAISLRGESISDFRDIKGRRGLFDKERKVYRREGKKCFRCGAIIKRVRIGGRSSYFCPQCQKIK